MPISIPEHARLSLANPQPSFEKPRIPLEQPPNLFPVDHISDKSDRHLMRRAELAMLAPPSGVSGQPVRAQPAFGPGISFDLRKVSFVHGNEAWPAGRLEVSGLTYDPARNELYLVLDEQGGVYRLSNLPTSWSNEANLKTAFKDIRAERIEIDSIFGKDLDLEGTAFVDGSLYLVASGKNKPETQFYRCFQKDGRWVGGGTPMVLQHPELNNIEGLTYNPDTKSFVFMCKGAKGDKATTRAALSLKKEAWQAGKEANLQSEFTLKLADLNAKLGADKLEHCHPSGISYDSATKTYTVIGSAKGKFEATLDIHGGEARVLSAKRLNSVLCPQPEGITHIPAGHGAFFRILANEEQKKKGGNGSQNPEPTKIVFQPPAS